MSKITLMIWPLGTPKLHLEVIYWNNGGKRSKWLMTKSKFHDVITTSRFKRRVKYD